MKDHRLKFICLKTKHWFWKNNLEQRNFQEKPSCKSESKEVRVWSISRSWMFEGLKITQSLKISQKIKCRPWSQLLWLFESTKMQKGLEDWSNDRSEELEGFGCLFSEKWQWRTNSTIVQPLPPQLQHFLRIVQAKVVSLFDWNG